MSQLDSVFSHQQYQQHTKELCKCTNGVDISGHLPLDTYPMFFSSHSSHCSALKLLEMLPSSIPCHGCQPCFNDEGNETNIEQHGRCYMYTSPSIRLYIRQLKFLSTVPNSAHLDHQLHIIRHLIARI